MLRRQERYSHSLAAMLVVLACLLMGSLCAEAKEVPVDAIRLETELDTYNTEVDRVLAYWFNTGARPVKRKTAWELQRWSGLMWRTVEAGDESPKKGNEPNSVDIWGGEKQKVVFDLTAYQSTRGILSAGRYRIASHFLEWDSVSKNRERPVYAEFQIVDDEDYVNRSELNQLDLGAGYGDITPGGAFDETTAHVYKHRQNYHSVLVYQGRKYNLGEYEGGLGVTYCRYFEEGEDAYLIYAYSYKGTPRQSRVAVFDLRKKETVFLSPVLSGCDVLYLQDSPVIGGRVSFNVYWAQRYALDGGQVKGYGNGKHMGVLNYSEGQFRFVS